MVILGPDRLQDTHSTSSPSDSTVSAQTQAHHLQMHCPKKKAPASLRDLVAAM